MVDTFGTASFQLIVLDHQKGRDAQLNVEHIPWSDIHVFQLGGRLPRTFVAAVRFAGSTQEDGLDALVNTSGTLSYADTGGSTTTASVILKSLQRSRQMPGGVRLGRAEFVYVG